MLRRDFIMVQLEELGKAIAQIIELRNANDTRKILQMVQVVYDSLKIDRNFLLNGEPHDIRRFLDGEDDAGLQRLEIAVKALLEEACADTDNAKKMRSKAKELLEYIQARDTTFSLERLQLLDEIRSQSSQGV
ncbi:MAG: hypothetical protein LBU37_08390 [Tannerellaceae bacterium]|jgi:Tfp pilus assembly ATPase PilU|nr:hypothetical protein [Tannerellaceae bacterium]